MTIQEAIEKAKKGGWQQPLPQFLLNSTIDTRHSFFDPAFWQALGKALGWKSDTFEHTRGSHADDFADVEPCHCGERDWLYHWHRFIDHLAEGGTPESFFATLK